MGGTVKYTASNEGNVNQVCGKTRQNKWKMKGPPNAARTRRGTDFGGSRESESKCHSGSSALLYCYHINVETGSSVTFMKLTKVDEFLT
jgi:hypothetical protein